jgi:hypothetical protein
MNPLSQKDVDLILQQLELLVSSLNKSPQLLTLYTCFAFIDRLAETKRPTLDLAQVQKLVILLEKIYFIKHKSFPDIHSSYRSLRDVTQIMDSEVNALAAFYNFLRPQVVKIRRTFTDQFRVLFNQQTGMDYKSSGYDYIGKKESDIITGFWSFHLEQSLLAFRQNKSPEHLDNIMACLPLWLASCYDQLIDVRTERKELSALQLLDMINNYLNLCDEFIDSIRQMTTSRLEQLPLLDPTTLQKQIELRDLEQITLLKQNISEIKIVKELPKTEKAKLKLQKDQLNEELSGLLRKQKQEVEEKLHENKKHRHKLHSLEKRAKVYRENLILRLEREVVKTLHYLISTYDLQRAKDPTWSNAKKQMRKFFNQQISNLAN